MPIFILVFLIPSVSFAFLDFIANQAKKAIEISSYIDAASELTNEISPDEDIKRGARDINDRASKLRYDAYNLKYTSQVTKDLLSGPDWSSKRLDTNIRNTSEYVRRLKRLVARTMALGLDGTVAVNTFETNLALNEVQKNQQALLIQNEGMKITQVEREQEEQKEWHNFSNQQRKIRGKRNGKF